MDDHVKKAVSITRRLRSVIMNIVAIEKAKENYDAGDDSIEDFFTEAADDDTPAVDLLAQVDTLLYALMSYDGTGEAWVDADSVETKEILKLKEIIALK